MAGIGRQMRLTSSMIRILRVIAMRKSDLGEPVTLEELAALAPEGTKRPENWPRSHLSRLMRAGLVQRDLALEARHAYRATKTGLQSLDRLDRHPQHDLLLDMARARDAGSKGVTGTDLAHLAPPDRRVTRQGWAQRVLRKLDEEGLVRQVGQRGRATLYEITGSGIGRLLQ